MGGVLVGLTRPVGANTRLALALRERGVTVRELPLVEISLLPGAVDALVDAARAGHDVWFAVTSANATQAVAQAGARLGTSLPVASIGPATSSAARHHGLEVALESPEPSARSLAEALATRHPGLVVWSQAKDPLPDLAVGLQANGIAVVQVPTYTTSPAVLSGQQAATLLECDLLTVASPSAVSALATLAHDQSIPPLVSIGPTTTRAAEKAGLFVVAEAQTPSLTEMVRAIERAAATLGPRRLGR